MRWIHATIGAGLIVWVSGSAVTVQPARAVVQVLVLGADGVPLAGLTREDFRVTVGGQPLVVESLESGPSPASIVVFFDVSASVDGSYGKGNAAEASRGTIESLLTASPAPVDRWRFGTFARELRMGPGLSSDAAELRASADVILAIADAERFGPSPAWDAADAGVTALEGERGRRGVVLVSDGQSTGNGKGLADALRHAVTAGVPISAIGPSGEERFPVNASTALVVNSSLGLKLLASETGGGYHPAFLPVGSRQVVVLQDLAGPLERIAFETRSSYLIGFTSPGAAGPKRLEIVVTRPGATVRAPASIVSR